jgi:hypothetical protein
MPFVVYAKRTYRSPPSPSSSWTMHANRLSPARCGIVSCSTGRAAPHGVLVAVCFVATAANVPAASSRVCDGFVPKARRAPATPRADQRLSR